MRKKNGDWEPQDFLTFGAKLIAGIGQLPNTIKDRSILITLKRKMGAETAERFREREEKKAIQPLRDRITTWASKNIATLREASTPPILATLNDRQQDVCDPLIQIVHLIGGEWPTRLEKALKEVCGHSDADESLGISLLSDVRDIFNEAKVDALPTTEIISQLAEIQTSPWGDWNRGKGLTPHSLAKLLKDFKVSPKKIRAGEETFRGYERASFEDSFARYLPSHTHIRTPQVEQVEHASVYAGETLFSQSEQKESVPLSKSQESPAFMRVVPLVPLPSLHMGVQGGGKAEKTLSRCQKCGSYALYREKDGSATCQTYEAALSEKRGA